MLELDIEYAGLDGCPPYFFFFAGAAFFFGASAFFSFFSGAQHFAMFLPRVSKPEPADKRFTAGMWRAQNGLFARARYPLGIPF